MITNASLTIYHKNFNKDTRLEKWTAYNYPKVWWFGGKGNRFNRGFENANDVEVRIPYDMNEIDIDKIQIGDILVKGTLTEPIHTQQDLKDYEVYNITSINNNNFGNSQHIHLGGR